MHILDSNVISELRRGKVQPSGAVRAGRQNIHSAQSVGCDCTGDGYWNAPHGAQGCCARPHSSCLEHGSRSCMQTPHIGLFAISPRLYAPRCMSANPRSFRNSMIAAAALEHGLTLVTRNVSDFAGNSGLQLLNPGISKAENPAILMRTSAARGSPGRVWAESCVLRGGRLLSSRELIAWMPVASCRCARDALAGGVCFAGISLPVGRGDSLTGFWPQAGVPIPRHGRRCLRDRRQGGTRNRLLHHVTGCRR